MLYLASPYTHKSKRIMQKRFKDVTIFLGRLISLGYVVFGPITMSHPVQQHFNMPSTWNFWQKPDTEILKKCNGLVVLTLPGWDESIGVKAEIEIAREMDIPIVYLDLDLSDSSLKTAMKHYEIFLKE